MKVVLKEWFKRPKHLILFIVGIVFSALGSVVSVSNEKLLAMIFDTLGDPKIISQFVIGVLLSGVFALVKKYTTRVIHCQYTSMNNDFSDKVLDSEYNMFLQYPSDRVLSISEQMFQITGSITCLGDMIKQFIQIIVLVFAIRAIVPDIALPLVVVYTIGACILWKIYKKWGEIDRKADEYKRARNHELDMIVNGFKEVRGFCTEDMHRGKVREYNRMALGMFCKRQDISIAITLVFRLINAITYVVVIAYCVPKLISGEISPAFAVLLASYAVQLSDPMEYALDSLDDLSQRLARIGEYEKFMAYENHYVEQRSEVILESFRSEIKLTNLGFTYGNKSSDDVLKDITMVIKKGERVGICGESGGGKTTLFNILMDYYTPNAGSISVDGIDYRDIDPSSIRSHIGIVNQDIYIFDDTIWFNVSYGKSIATEAEVVEACKKAGIYDFICKLKDGFQTKVGPKGLKLSGGQKQRIGLARVFLVNPEIILLDEATSALDNESETIVQDALSALQGKTLVTIAHRLSTIRDSDRIYVIGNGSIVESGTHEELIELGGVYAKLNK